MSSQPVEANVVLTADTGQYNQAMEQSTQSTNAMMNAVDSLSTKIGQLTKSAGKKFMGVAAADVAAITAATMAYGAFEKQMVSLNVQSAITTKTMAGQRRVMGEYTDDVNKLRRNFAMSTAEAAQLEQTLTKMSDRSTSIQTLGKTFGKLGEATGESAASLGSSMLQLQKTMGTPQRETSKFSSQLLTLQSRANTSAESILNFSQQIAPVGRAANISQTDLMGFSTAFIKAGQDGYQAANVFNKMMTDITQATVTGSPELNKYANLVGMTNEQFKNMGGSDQFIKIFEAINRQGPQAISTLNRMGLDGARTVRTVTAMAQSGGMGAEIEAARGADPNAVNKGATASETLFKQLKKMRTEMTQTAEAIGENFAGPAKIFFGAVTMMAKGVRMFVESPLGKVVAWAVAIGGAFAGVAGAILLASKALLTFSGANMIWNSAMGQGLRGVNKGLATDPKASAFTSKSYGWGAAARAGLTSDTPGSGPGMLSRTVGTGLTGAGRMTAWTTRMLYGSGSAYVPGVVGSGGYDDPVARQSGGRGLPPGFRTMPGAPMRGPTGMGLGAIREGWRMGSQTLASEVEARRTAVLDSRQVGNIGKGGLMAAHADELKRAEVAAKSAKAMADLEKGATGASRGLMNFGKSASQAMMMIGSTGVGAGKFAGSMAKSAYGLVGGNPLLAGGLAAFGGYSLMKKLDSENQYQYKDTGGFSDPYYKSAGLTAPSASPYSYQKNQPLTLTLGAARSVSPAEIAVARGKNYSLHNSALKGLSSKDAEARLRSNWSDISTSPKMLDQTMSDLVNLYGSTTAEQMAQSLDSGQAPALTRFAAKAASPGKSFWSGLGGEQSGKKTSKQLNQFYGGLETQTAAQAELRGPDYAQRQRGKTIVEGVDTYLAKRKGGTETAFEQGFIENVLGVKDIKDRGNYRDRLHALNRIEPAGWQGDEVQNTKEMLKYQFSESGVFGAKGQGGLRKEVLSQQGIGDTTLTGDKAAMAIYKAITNPPPQARDEEGETVAQNLKNISDQFFGQKGVMGNRALQYALGEGSGDPNAQFRASQSVLKGVQRRGGSKEDQMLALNQMVSGTEGVTDLGVEQIKGARQLLQRQIAFEMPYQNRTEQFSTQTGQMRAAMNTPISASFTKEDRMAAEDQYQTQVQQQYDYFKNLLYQQREYEVMRKRAQEDYNLQRTYQEEAFNRSRHRAEADFALMRERATANFNRQTFRANRDFNLQRKRGEEDHNHQTKLMIEQQSKSMMDVYTRVQTVRTHSAQWLLSNAADQQKRMEEQSGNLEKLRGMGMSKQAIQQMGFTDPAKAADLARFATEAAADPKLVKEFNKTVSKRLKAAKDLVTDESSSEWTEYNRSYKLARTRGQHDFTVSMRESRDDFQRGLREQADDFHRSLRRQQEDYQIGMDQQAVAYKKTMDRSAEDLERAAKTIDGNFEEILRKATRGLSGHAKRQAEAVLGEFTTLKGDTSKEGIALMTRLAAIFGVDYNPPKIAKDGGKQTTAQDVKQLANKPKHMPGGDFAAGGVLPGYTPGKDVHHFHSPTAGNLHLSGGEAIMVPEWVRAIGGEKVVKEQNDKARRGFATGGVFWPVPGHRTGTYPGHDGVDINRGSGSDDLGDPIRAFRAGRIVYVGTGHGYGEAIFEKTSAGTVVYGHTSRQHVHAGQQVRAGQLIGNVGSTGHSSAPHLHFGIPGGTTAQALALLRGASYSGMGGLMGAAGAGQGTPINPMDLLKERYPVSEHTARMMASVHPLNVGSISHVMNKFARKKIHQWIKKYGTPMDTSGGYDNLGSQPAENLANERLVHIGANRMGWGDQWPSLRQLVMHESGFRNTAQNPTSSAYGMFQFLDGTWAGVGGHKTSDPWKQTQYGLRYIKNSGNFHDPNSAWKFWQKHHWYGDGSVFNGPQTIGVGEKGPEAVIPLNERGANFLTDVMGTVMGGRATTPMRGGLSVYNTRIDRSTNFHGPITVQANNPHELINKLKSRQRVMALSRPSLTGSAA